MKTGKILLALVLTLVLLFIARKLAMVQPRPLEVRSGDYTIGHLNPGKAAQNQSINLELKLGPALTSGQKVLLTFVYGNGNAEWLMAEMALKSASANGFTATLNGQPKGIKLLYYFEIQDSLGSVIANLGTEQNPLHLRFEGIVPAYIIVPHIFCMFAGAFFAFLAVFGAISLVKRGGEVGVVARKVGWVTLFIFMGGFPLGIMAARAAGGGTGWGGFPFGNDITDNKTLLIFLYWLILLILGKGSIFQKNAEKNLVKPATYGKLTLIGFILFLGLFLIPHSI